MIGVYFLFSLLTFLVQLPKIIPMEVNSNQKYRRNEEI